MGRLAGLADRLRPGAHPIAVQAQMTVITTSQPPARDSDRESVEAEMVARAIDGDPEALGSLWHKHRRWIAAVLLAHKPRRVELEDLLQEVAMTLVSKVQTLRDGSKIRAWLRTVAVNAARASARSAADTSAAGADEGAHEHQAAEALAGDEEAQRLLEEVLDLPELYREPLMLRAVHGLRTRQIAEILQIAAPTVDPRIARARRMLREQLPKPRRRPATPGAAASIEHPLAKGTT